MIKFYDATKEHSPFERSKNPSKEHPNKKAAREKKKKLDKGQA